MTKGTFGESLKRERELRGVTLDEISAATRIATRFLKAIENEQWDQLPGGVFNRGFVRAMARFLGLDEENTVAEYTLAVGDRPSVPVWTGSPPAVTPEQPWLAWTIAAVLILALLAGGWFGARRFLAWRAARRAARATAVTAAPAPPNVLLPPVAASTSLSEGQQDSSASPAVPTAADSEAANAPGASALAPLELKIEAGKKTNVTVVADKEVVFDGTMKAGTNNTFSALDHFQVSAKDAGALVLELNGKTLAPIGPPGQEGKITLTREGLKEILGGGN
jgi:cytoskeleton protein RodZ